MRALLSRHFTVYRDRCVNVDRFVVVEFLQFLNDFCRAKVYYLHRELFIHRREIGSDGP